MIVAVGSTNPTKIEPVKDMFSLHFKNVRVKGVAVNSGVSDQPMTDEEMYKGALARAKEALKKVKSAQYGVGIEGGVHKYSYGWFERSMVVIVDKKGHVGIGSSGGLVLPDKVMNYLHKGKTLEQAIDDLFKTRNVGRGIGMFGIFTKGVVTRSQSTAHGVAYALARFLHPRLYPE
jgi:inosine/xanthosine triphosphatase